MCTISRNKASRFGRCTTKLHKRLLALLCLSVRPSAWSNATPTIRIFVKIYLLRETFTFYFLLLNQLTSTESAIKKYFLSVSGIEFVFKMSPYTLLSDFL